MRDELRTQKTRASETPQRIRDGEINFSCVRGEDGGSQEPAAIALSRLVQHGLEFADIGVSSVVKAHILAIKAGDAVDGLIVNGGGQLAREYCAVAGEIAFPFLVAGGGVEHDRFQI